MRTFKTLVTIIALSVFATVIGLEAPAIGAAKKNEPTLADMLAVGKYDWVDDSITQKNFPVDAAHFSTEGCKVFRFDKLMTTAEIEAAIRKKGYEPATIERLLAYGVENPGEQRMHPIVGLGTIWVGPDGRRRVPDLYGDDRERGVFLVWGDPMSQWNADYHFLAVRK